MQILKKSKSLLKKGYHYYKFYTDTKNSFPTGHHTSFAKIHFSNFLLNSDMGRFSFILCQHFRFSGFKIVLEVTRHFFLREARYKLLLRAQDYELVRKLDTDENTIWLHIPGAPPKAIKILHGYQYIHPVAEGWYFPFTLHPRFYKERLSPTLFLRHRQSAKKIRIFFAGNTDSTLYSRDTIRTEFNMLPRADIIDYLKKKSAVDPRISFIRHTDRLYEWLQNGNAVDKVVISDARTPDTEWLPILAQTCFFISLPGVRMPWSHNACEAMAMGSIPIIPYAHLFYPPLEHMKTCISYNTLEDFEQAIETALQMKEEQMAQMRKNVADYYDTYLSTESIIKKITDFSKSSGKNMTLVIPYLEEPQT